LIFFEAPHRLLNSLEDMVAVLGNRRVTMARELTKIHEEIFHGTLAELLDNLQTRPAIRGEVTLVIERGEAAAVESSWPCSIRQHLEEEMTSTGLSRNEALKAVAKKRGMSRRDAYNQLTDELRTTEEPE
jgi:16S rRNA (cytidine1402-2'-O)-methyltransferase